MKIIQELYKINGVKHIKVSEGYELLAIFLTWEVQDEEFYNEIKAVVVSSLKDQFSTWETQCEVTTLVITKNKVIIKYDISDNEKPLTIDHESFLEALETWYDYYSGQYKNQSRLEKNRLKKQKKKKDNNGL